MTMAGAALAGCTFTPAYAPGGPAAALQGAVRVDSPDTKDGFDLVERLEERLGRPSNPRFNLSYQIRTDRVGVGVTPENAITRYHLRGRIDWQLSDMDGNRLTGAWHKASPHGRQQGQPSRVCRRKRTRPIA